jgi:two-component system phosphate regulon sensor histidine kinase PhoR
LLAPVAASLAGLLVGAAIGGWAAPAGAPGFARIVPGACGAVLAGGVAALFVYRGLHRRLQRLVDLGEALGRAEAPPFVAAARPDELGAVERSLGEAARRVHGQMEELRVGRERLEAILRGMVEGVVVTDLDGRVLLTNARARELLDVDETVATRRPIVDLVRTPTMADLMRELAQGGSMATRDVMLAEGPTFHVNAARLQRPDGHSFGFVIVLHDVTELRRLEVVRRDFVANVSHELRTPLTAIKGYAETLLGSAGDDRQVARRFLQVIDRHSERLGRLIDDLLVLSDLELGRTPLALGEVNVAAAVDDVLQILSDAARRAEVRLGAQVTPGTPQVLADGDRLRQVLINLVDNAVKYTPAGGEVVVRVGPAGAPRPSATVEIAVVDTGLGIPAQDLPRLTERFFRVDKARSRELGGTGLGLAIVKHIVQAHRGELAITSTVGQGTTVSVYLPSVELSREAAQA